MMSAFTLRCIATLAMLLDHIGYCYGIFPLRIVGRLAFPLYVFLMVNGFRYTKSRIKYAARFAIFALISQIPFQLMRYSRIKSLSDFISEPSLLTDNLNVMVTLLIGLLVIWLGDLLRKGKRTKYICLLPSIAAFFAYYFGLISSDYGAKGILLATTFWFFDGKKLWTALGLFVSMFYDMLLRYASLLLKGQLVPLGAWEKAQFAILLTLPLIYLYNKKSGMPLQRKKAIQIGFYAFYPAHMLLLWAIVELTA